MITWVLKNTAEYRVDTMAEVEDFNKKLQTDAAENGYTLSSFSWVKKEVKSGGEVIDEYFIVKASNVFNDAKEPENAFLKVEFPKQNVEFQESEDSQW